MSDFSLKSSDVIIHLAPEGYEQELLDELGGNVEACWDRLFLANGPSASPVWSLNTWTEPMFIPIDSISDGAKALKELQRNWSYFPLTHHRRASLSQEKLPKISAKPIPFLGEIPKSPLGAWTLLDQDLMLASPKTTSPFPHGEVHFIEDETTPPSRAYLKL